MTLRDRAAAVPMIRGGSCVVSPLGEVIAGPVADDESLITAQVDLDDIVRARFDLDVNGHYVRPDIFTLTVDAGAAASQADPRERRPPPTIRASCDRVRYTGDATA